MKTYEVLVIFSPQVGGLDSKNSFEDAVKKFDGKVINRTEMGRRQVGYIIKKSHEGYLAFFDIELAADKVTSFKKALDLTEDILKYTIVIKRKPKILATK